ncbi:MAG: T9SS type A sorting domain-containing protein [Candidatus Cloacimonetes bacterium]|nr:T9SS type A sorting domain-containing protein [Candidatus Cloacimonadota bacterium]
MKAFVIVVFVLLVTTLIAQDLTELTQFLMDEDEVGYFKALQSMPGDINNDGFDDYLREAGYYSEETGTQGFVACYFGSDQPSQYADSLYCTSDVLQFTIRHVYWNGDINGDGFNDLVHIFIEYDATICFISYQNGSFSTNIDVSFIIPGWGGYCPLIEDFNNDGYDDFALSLGYLPYGGDMFIYYGGEPFDTEYDVFIHRFTDHNPEDGELPFIAQYTCTGDLNGDSIPDLIYSISGGYGDTADRFSIYCGGENFGTQTTSVPTVHQYGSMVNVISNGDFNGDGCDDICFSNYDDLYLYWGSESLNFPVSIIQLREGGRNSRVFYCNINNDEYDDIVVRNRYDDFIDIYFGGEELPTEPSITISIETPESLPIYNSFFGCNLGDINGDGRNDILINDGGDMRSATVYYMNTISNEENVQPEFTADISNYPNPFTGITTFTVNTDKVKLHGAELQIFNIKGQKIREIPIESSNSVTWDGKNQNDDSVPSGVYFYKIMAQSYSSKINKMLYLKQ